METPVDSAAVAARAELVRSAFATRLGIAREALERDRAVYTMEFRGDNTTVADIVHGGAISSLVDCAATAAVWTTVDDPERHRGATVDLSVSFLEAARSQALTAEARVLRRGSRICFCGVEVRDREGRLVAHARVVYSLIRRKSPSDSLAGAEREEENATLGSLGPSPI
jgi:uncharacterized protein (TIGR00369 family)